MKVKLRLLQYGEMVSSMEKWYLNEAYRGVKARLGLLQHEELVSGMERWYLAEAKIRNFQNLGSRFGNL